MCVRRAQPSPGAAQPSPAQPKSRSKKQNPPAVPKIPKSNSKAKKKNRPAQPSQKPALPQIRKSNCKSKTRQNPTKPPKPGKTPDPNPIQFLGKTSKPLLQLPSRQSPERAHSPENKSKSKTRQNPPKLRTQTLYNFYSKSKTLQNPPKTRQNSGPKPYTISFNPNPKP